MNIFHIFYICSVIPGSHSAGLARVSLLNNYLEEAGSKSEELRSSLESGFSVKIDLFSNSIDKTGMFVYLIVTTVVFLILNVVILKVRSNKR